MAESIRFSMPSEREILVERIFEAPAERVFAAMTTPEALEHWFGPRGWTPLACEMDLRVGGLWSMVLEDSDKNTMVLHGTYKEIDRPRRLVFTETWEGFETGETLATALFDEREGRTDFSIRILYPSQEVRDAIFAIGMKDAVTESYSLLADYLADG